MGRKVLAGDWVTWEETAPKSEPFLVYFPGSIPELLQGTDTSLSSRPYLEHKPQLLLEFSVLVYEGSSPCKKSPLHPLSGTTWVPHVLVSLTVAPHPGSRVKCSKLNS